MNSNNFFKSNFSNESEIRTGCKDVWNAFMSSGAFYGNYDIPYCPTTAKVIPKDLITWDEAKDIYRKHIAQKEKDFYIDCFVNWYIDDYRFDNSCGIWQRPQKAYEIIRHFAGIITPDFSTYQDFPEALKIYATYRMRMFGFWIGQKGVQVINNVRWGTDESFKYCFIGIPKNSIVCIGTVGGGPRRIQNRTSFENGFFRMVEELSPHTILIYGSAKCECFEIVKKQGINIVSYPSKTSRDFERRKQQHE